LDQIKGGDASTAESGSEAEDITSPKATRNYIAHPSLTPVREEVTPYLGGKKRKNSVRSDSQVSSNIAR